MCIEDSLFAKSGSKEGISGKMGLTGTNLDRYEVREELGRGGMSVVYQGLDSTLQRVVAIKVLHDHLTEDQNARDRLHREAVAVAKLQHQNIIEVFDFSTGDSGPAYIVMEFVEGEALADVLKRASFEDTPEEGLYFLRRILCALEHAHDNGVIHRDLKPENVLLSSEGKIKLTDFGIARLVDGNAMTLTGTLLGSPGYMAPEYIEAKPTDHRVDIFAFGVLLYRSLTGKSPFQGDSPASVLLKITKGEFQPANESNPRIHPQIAKLISTCLASNPVDRFRSVKELKSAIDDLLGHCGLTSESLEREVLPAPGQPNETFSKTSLERAYLSAFETAVSKQDRQMAHGHADRLIGLNPQLSEVLTEKLSGLGSPKHRSRFPLVFGILIGICAIGFAIAGALSSAPPEATLSQAMATPSPDNALPLTLEVACQSENKVEARLDGSGPWMSPEELTAQRVTPGSHRIELRVGGEVEEHLFSVDEGGKTSPSIISCRSTVIPPPPIKSPDDSQKSEQSKEVASQNKAVSTTAQKPPVQAPRKNTPPTPPAQTFEVQFRTGGAWVDVELDGEIIERNRLGVFSIELQEGARALRFLNPLAKPLEMTLDVNEATGERPILIRLSPLDAKLAFTGFPPKTVIQLRGKASLLSADGTDEPIAVSFPDNKGRLIERVRIILPDGSVKTQEVELKPGTLTTLDVAATR